MPNKPGADAIIVHNNKICLVLRDNIPTISRPNKWNAPGGGIDEGETPEEGLRRELKEEINLDATDIISLGSTTDTNGMIVYRFFVPVTDEQFQAITLLEEGQRLDWFTFDEVLEFSKVEEFTPNFTFFLEAFADDLKKLIEGKREFTLRHETLGIR